MRQKDIPFRFLPSPHRQSNYQPPPRSQICINIAQSLQHSDKKKDIVRKSKFHDCGYVIRCGKDDCENDCVLSTGFLYRLRWYVKSIQVQDPSPSQTGFYFHLCTLLIFRSSIAVIQKSVLGVELGVGVVRQLWKKQNWQHTKLTQNEIIVGKLQFSLVQNKEE